MIVNTLAFPKTEVSYDDTLPYLKMLDSPNGRIPICHYHKSDDLKTVIYSHANAEDIGHFEIEMLATLFNCNVILYDYAGYGMHECKKATEAHCYKDIMTVYDYALSCHIDKQNIVLYGRSIGTGPACYLAYQLNKKGINNKLILTTPFKSIVQVMINFKYYPGDIFCIEEMAPYITSPTLFIHGCNDKVTDYQQSKELSKSFCHLKRFKTFHGCGHRNLYLQPGYYDTIRQFIYQT